jgi:5-methylcytosine-specific restriction endonuclease McrA
MKVCKKCNIEKEWSSFNKNSSKDDGLHIWCKECSSTSNQKRYESKSESIKEKSSEYYYTNKEVILPKLKVYREQDEIKEKQKVYIKQWVIDNIDYYRQYQNSYTKERRKTDPRFKTICDLRTQINTYLKNKVKNNKTEDLLGYTYEDFINKIGIKQEGQEIDHKIPIDWFLDETPINVIWNLNNLQLTTKKYNRTKKNILSDPINTEFHQTVIKWIKPTQLLKISTYV